MALKLLFMDTALSSVLNENVDRLFRELIVDRDNNHVGQKGQKFRFPRKRKLSVVEPITRDVNLKGDFRSQRSFSVSGGEVECKQINCDLERESKGENFYAVRNDTSNKGCGLNESLVSTSGGEIGSKKINNDLFRESQEKKLCTIGNYIQNKTESESENVSRNDVFEKRDILFSYEVMSGMKYSSARENEGPVSLGTDSFPNVENWCSKNTMQSDLMDKLYSDFINGVHLKNKLRRPKGKRLRYSEGTSCDQLDYHGDYTDPGNFSCDTSIDSSAKEYVISDHMVANKNKALSVGQNEIVCSEVENVNSCGLDVNVTKQYTKSGTGTALLDESQTEFELESCKTRNIVSVKPRKLVQIPPVQINERIPDVDKNLKDNLNKSWSQDTINGTTEKLNSIYEKNIVNDLQPDCKNSENTTCGFQLGNRNVENTVTPSVDDMESAVSYDNYGDQEKINDTQLKSDNSLITDITVKKTKTNSCKNGKKCRINGLKEKIPKTKMTRNRLNSFNLIFPEPPPEGLWRSKRTRVPPLEWHKNERIIYDCGVVSGITISSEARIKQMEEQKALQKAKDKRENKEMLKRNEKQNKVISEDKTIKAAIKSHRTKTKKENTVTSKSRNKQLVRKIIKNSEKYLIEHRKNHKDSFQSRRHGFANVCKSSEKHGSSKKLTRFKSLKDRCKTTTTQGVHKDSKSRLSNIFENKVTKCRKGYDCIKEHNCSNRNKNCKHKHKHKEKTGTKHERGVSKKKDVCSTQILTQEVILRSHEENVNSENERDTFRTLSCLEDKDQIEACDLELLMPSTESVKWSNGSRMFTSLGLYDTENKINHPGGIWKSVVQEQ